MKSHILYYVLLCTIFTLIYSTTNASTGIETDSLSGNTERVQFKVSVNDAEENVPMELARVALARGGKYVMDGVTNTAGQVKFRDIRPGIYGINAWFIGYNTFQDTITIDNEHTTYKITLTSLGEKQNEVEVIGQREASGSHINMQTGNQVFESETYHAPPTTRMTNLIQQNLMGAVRAPTGEVHIRGQHGEFTYYVDGIPVPLGVFGGLNEVVDPKVIDRATFITGGFPAEYGGQMAAVVDLNNRVPTGTFHLDASTYTGSYLVSADSVGEDVGSFKALNSNGQALSVSDHLGTLGFFLSGARQETDRRIDQPAENLFHDHGFDYFLYGKFDYVLSDNDFMTSNINFGRTQTQVPYDPIEGIASDDQRTTNGFQTLSYFRTLNSDIDHESNLFIGGYAREGGLLYTPGNIDPPSFQFAGDTLHNYLLTEDRNFTTLGFRSTLDNRLTHELMYKIGLNFSSTNGTEDFTSLDASSNPGPSVITEFNGSDIGMFGQVEWHPIEWISFEIGARYDAHKAPDAPSQTQLSPRLRWNILIDDNNTAYLYYGRLFMPTNIEGLRSIALNVSRALVPTFPEKDDFYEAAYTHIFPFGLRSKLATFYKEGVPGIDDESVGASAIKTPVNIEIVKTTGLEAGLSYSSPLTAFSGYLNVAIIHAYGSGVISGGFLDFDNAGDASDLDHDQRLSIVAGLNYQPRDWFANLVATYGTGLANGNETAVFKTGLFDFNQEAHTTPSWILNLSGGRTFHLDKGYTIEPAIYITNLFDHARPLKGTYFSGASWEDRRNIVFKISLHI